MMEEEMKSANDDIGRLLFDEEIIKGHIESTVSEEVKDRLTLLLDEDKTARTRKILLSEIPLEDFCDALGIEIEVERVVDGVHAYIYVSIACEIDALPLSGIVGENELCTTLYLETDLSKASSMTVIRDSIKRTLSGLHACYLSLAACRIHYLALHLNPLQVTREIPAKNA